MVVSLSVVGIAIIALILAVTFLPLANERRRSGRTALTSAIMVTGVGVALMSALHVGGTASGVPLLVGASKIPLMAAFALPPIGGLAAVVFGLLGLGWPMLFDRPNDRFAANLYAMIAAGIMIICFAGGKHLHDDWPGYLIALFSIPFVPMLTKRRLGPRSSQDPDQLPKGKWAQPVIAQRKAKTPSKAISTPVKSKGPGMITRLARRIRALIERPSAIPEQRSPSHGTAAGSSVERATTPARPAPAATVRAKAAPSKQLTVERGAAQTDPVKRDITSIDVLPARAPARAKPTVSQPKAQNTSGRALPARPVRAAVPDVAARKTPTTLIIPERSETAPSAAVATIRPLPKVETIEELPERPPCWTNLMVGNITLEDGRSYSIAVRSTQTINENEIRKLAKAS
jgi:hypothetical protein